MSNYIVPASLAVGSALVLPTVYRKLCALNELRKAIELTDTLSNKKVSVLSSVSRTFRVLYMAFVIMAYQRLYGSTGMGKNFAYVPYFHNMKWYYFPVVTKRGPKPVISKAIDGDKDVTEFIIRLAGPNVDFYGHNIRPRDIKASRITITVDGEDKIFEEDDTLSL